MTAPFDYFAEFNMFATLHDGTIYLEEDFQAKAADRAAEPTNNRPQNPHMPSHKMMTYWGYKFETVSMLSDTPSQTPQAVIDNRTKAVVSNHAQHCSIVRTVIGPNSLILGGEVDGLSHPKPSNSDAPIPWVELKTAEELPRNPQHRDVLKYERKLLKFWAQSFLLGVEKVIVGFRSKQGILRAIDTYDTAKIPGMVRRGTACWDGNVCINFTASFLEHLKRTITEEGVYKITLQKRGGIIEVVKIRDKGTGGIVSQEFLDWRAREGKAVEPDSKDSVGRDKESGVHVKDSAETGQTNTLGVS
jgi:RAT1-interacting protein